MGELSGDWQDGGAPKREAEPSMEDILSSIKRIIAEDSEAQPERGERRARPMSFAAAARSVTAAAAAEAPAATYTDESANDDVLELSEAMTESAPATPQEESVAAAPVTEAAAPRRKAAKLDALTAASTAEREPGPDLVSGTAALASRSSLDALSRLVVKPDVSGSDTLEGMVREMLRPMLSEWLDANLPLLVETMVAKEIARITGQAR